MSAPLVKLSRRGLLSGLAALAVAESLPSPKAFWFMGGSIERLDIERKLAHLVDEVRRRGGASPEFLYVHPDVARKVFPSVFINGAELLSTRLVRPNLAYALDMPIERVDFFRV